MRQRMIQLKSIYFAKTSADAEDAIRRYYAKNAKNGKVWDRMLAANDAARIQWEAFTPSPENPFNPLYPFIMGMIKK